MPREHTYQSMGTTWKITIWDEISDDRFSALMREIEHMSQTFDETYSRFIKTSLVWNLAGMTGEVTVPEDLTRMLRIYRALYLPTNGKLNPLIGFSISDLGYDADYSLTPKEHARKTPDFLGALTITSPTSITLHEHVLIDLGALGKGYFVDKIAEYLSAQSMVRFLVDGSGDIFYCGGHERSRTPIMVGLEDPEDRGKVIGQIPLSHGSICASGINRRVWREYNHVIDPHTLTSPKDILATWVYTQTAAEADALASCLFFVPPENISDFSFEYCIINRGRNVKRSAGFTAELF